ncbi:MAG: hypothetical protein ACE5JO_05755 [Candidatus Binatia bacterium]
MTKQVVIEKVRTEIAKLIRCCRWSARQLNTEGNIRRQEENIATLQYLVDALGCRVPEIRDPEHPRMVRGVYRGKQQEMPLPF